MTSSNDSDEGFAVTQVNLNDEEHVTLRFMQLLEEFKTHLSTGLPAGGRHTLSINLSAQEAHLLYETFAVVLWPDIASPGEEILATLKAALRAPGKMFNKIRAGLKATDLMPSAQSRLLQSDKRKLEKFLRSIIDHPGPIDYDLKGFIGIGGVKLPAGWKFENDFLRRPGGKPIKRDEAIKVIAAIADLDAASVRSWLRPKKMRRRSPMKRR